MPYAIKLYISAALVYADVEALMFHVQNSCNNRELPIFSNFFNTLVRVNP